MQEQSVRLDVTVFILNIFSTPNPTAAIEAQCGTTKRLNYAHSTTGLEKRVKFLKCFVFVLLTRRVQLKPGNATVLCFTIVEISMLY